MSKNALIKLEQILSVRTPEMLDSGANPFEDTNGLISFVNLASSNVTTSPQFSTGRQLCDMISNFFATLRPSVFTYLQKNPQEVPPGDPQPQTQWDPAVNHMMENLLFEAGGLATNLHQIQNYSNTQNIATFSTSMIQTLFDATSLPDSIVSSAVTFCQQVGQSLQVSWNNRENSYQVALLSQCHEAIAASPTDQSAFLYFPKVSYYYLEINSSQTAFTSNCATMEELTFNFTYEAWVSGLTSAVLDPSSTAYANFVAFLQKAQSTSYQNASNQLSGILGGTTSNPPSVNLTSYPRVLLKK